MKYTLSLFAYIFIFCFALSTIAGCAKKACTNPKSDNYNADAKKDEGTCVPWRDKFIGSYSSVDNCATAGSTYTLTITSSSVDEDKILISDGTLSFDGEVTGESTANIPNQTGNESGYSYTISGSLDISGNTITMNYTFSSQGASVTCLVTGNKL